jgi:hypothetical protein
MSVVNSTGHPFFVGAKNAGTLVAADGTYEVSKRRLDNRSDIVYNNKIL